MTSLLSQSPGAKPSASTSSQSTSTEYTVRVPNDPSKKHSMIKFSSGTNIDFNKLTNASVRMERENNLREYKSAHNLDTMPKFGAGSEYGREQKEEARRKKYGIHIKKYNPEDQPWLMKVGKGKDAKRYKGVREGTISENTSYYIFTQCADGAFEAHPIDEWYNFQPMINYKYLNSEEAEEEFNRRDRTMNLFSVMVRKRIKNESETAEQEEGEKAEKTSSKSKKDKSLILTDMDDWMVSSEEEEEEGEDGEKKKKKETKKSKKPGKQKRNSKHNDNDEAIEESDEGDFDDRELDYITDSGDSDSDLDEKEKDDKYDDKGVDQEHGLKKLIDSDESSEEEEDKKEDEDLDDEEEEEKTNSKKSKKKKNNKESKEGEESDSSSSSSESDDSDIEKNEEKFSSVLFMQKKKSASRSATPTMEKAEEPVKSEQKSEAVKRKLETDESAEPPKKVRTESPSIPTPSSSGSSSGEITEEAIRRYLMRKPMTAKEVMQKFKSKKLQMTNEQMIHKIAQLLKKINPNKNYVKNVLYLSVKKTE